MALAFLLARWRLIVAVTGLMGASWCLWRIHDALAEQRVHRAIEAVREQTERETREQVEAEHHEQLQQQRDAKVVAQARQSLALSDYSHCPDVPAEYFRMLNAIGEAGSAPGDPSG